MEIWIPNIVYRALPVTCLAIGGLSLFTVVGTASTVLSCSLLLYGAAIGFFRLWPDASLASQ